jgi:hypothetical protein
LGQQVRFRMPSSLDEAVQVAVTVMQNEQNRLTLGKCLAQDGTPVPRQLYVTIAVNEDTMRETRFRGKEDSSEGNGRARQMAGGRRAGKTDPGPRNSPNPGTQKGKFFRCYNCNKIGHRRDKCPLLTGQTATPSPQTTAGRRRGPRNRPRTNRRAVRF